MFLKQPHVLLTLKNKFSPDAVPHVMVFGICLAVLSAAWVLGSIDWIYERIIHEKTGLPGLCMFRNLTGLPCPGCGLTRSFVSAGKGNLALSLCFHRFGWLVILYTLLQMVRHAGWLVFTERRLRIERFGLWLDRGLLLIAAVLLFNWFYTLFRIFQVYY